MRKCQKPGCPEVAAVRFTWPGRDEASFCIACAVKAKAVADAMGFHLQFIPLSIDDHLKEESHVSD